MSSQVTVPSDEGDLRFRAFLRLTGRTALEGVLAQATGALRVLHELALSPATAADALALLHEFQVHQVELELQEENMGSALAELQMAFDRQTQVYDFAPVGYFTLDRGTAIHELNLTGAELLGFERDALLGRTLDSFLTPQSSLALHAMLARVGAEKPREVCALHVMSRDGLPRTVQACANADPAGRRFLVALVASGED